MLPLRFFALVVLSCAISGAQERPLPKNLSGEWLQFSETHTPAYNAPAWKRLLLSIRPWGEVGASHARVKLDTTGANLSGGGERFSYSKMIPDSYGIGISGGIK